MNFLLKLSAGAVVLAAVLLMMAQRTAWQSLYQDTVEYKEFAAAILDGSITGKSPVASMPEGVVKRTPGFPFILALAEIVAPSNPLTSLTVLYTAVFLASYVLLAMALKGHVPPVLLSLALCLCALQCEYYFRTVSTEWIALCGILAVYAILIELEKKISLWALSWLALLSSFLVLLRPALIPVTLIPLFFSFRVSRPCSRIGILGLTFLPLILWAGFNGWRIGVFSLAPVSGRALFCAGSLSGTVSVEAEDSEVFRQFNEEFERRRLLLTDAEIETANSVQEKQEVYKYVENLHVAEDILEELGVDAVRADALMRQWAVRAIFGNFNRYMLHFSTAVISLRHTLWMLIPYFLYLYGPFRQSHRIMLLPTGILVVFHVLHILEIALFQPVVMRYYALTLVPIELGGLAMLGAMFTDLTTSLR